MNIKQAIKNLLRKPTPPIFQFKTSVCAKCGTPVTITGVSYSSSWIVEVVGDDRVPASYVLNEQNAFCTKAHMVAYITEAQND